MLTLRIQPVTAALFSVWLSATATARMIPTLTGFADPCTETCSFHICVVGNKLQDCATQCGNLGTRVELPAPGAAIIRFPRHAVVGGTPILGPGLRAELLCVGNTRPCFVCHADSDCDDQNPNTRDLCFSDPGACLHVCP